MPGVNIKKHAKEWRVNKLKEPCEFCKSEPREVKGILGIMDNFIYGDRCVMCFELIERDRDLRTRNSEIIKYALKKEENAES